MSILGWSASVRSSARARYGKPLFAAFFIACAVFGRPSYTRAQAPTRTQAPADKSAFSGRSAAELIAALRKADRAARPAIEKELLSKGGEAVKPMIELMADKRGQDRVMVMIANLGEKAPPALIALLPDDKLRSDAARALAHAAGSFSGGQAPELIACMSRWQDVKHYCGIALGRGMSPKQSRWIPNLAAALKSFDRDQRLYAVVALKQIGLKTPGVREALMTAVSDQDDEVRAAVRRTGLKPAPKEVKAK